MFRNEKLKSLFETRSAEFFRTEVTPGIIVTVSDVLIESDGQKATIFITVLPESKDQEVIRTLEKTTGRLKTYIHEHAQIGHLPDFHIEIDRGEKLRQKIDSLHQ